MSRARSRSTAGSNPTSPLFEQFDQIEEKARSAVLEHSPSYQIAQSQPAPLRSGLRPILTLQHQPQPAGLVEQSVPHIVSGSSVLSEHKQSELESSSIRSDSSSLTASIDLTERTRNKHKMANISCHHSNHLRINLIKISKTG